MTAGARFVVDAIKHGDRLLATCGLDRGVDTYVVSAPVAGYTHLFDPARLDEIVAPESWAIVQHTLTSDRLSHTGRFPLANPAEIVGGHFRFGDRTVQAPVGEVLRRLQMLTGLQTPRFHARTTRRLGLAEAALAAGVPAAQIHVHPNAKRLSLGAGKPSGEYLYIYARYRHGVVPIASVGVIDHSRGFASDCSLFVERAAMIRDGVRWPSEWSGLRRGAEAAVATAPVVCGDEIVDRHRWMYLARAAVLCLLDGVAPSHSLAGHSVKRVIRMLAAQLLMAVEGTALVDDAIRRSAYAAVADWHTAGYVRRPGSHIGPDEVATQLASRVAGALKQLRAGLTRTVGALRDDIAGDDFARWAHDTYGVATDVLAAHLDRLGRRHRLDTSRVERTGRSIVGYIGYPFAESGVDLETAKLFAQVCGTTPLTQLDQAAQSC